MFLGKKEKSSQATNVKRGDMQSPGDKRNEAKKITSLEEKTIGAHVRKG